MCEFINDLCVLNQISRDTSDDLMEVILAEVFFDPESNVLIAGWVLGIWLELCDFTSFELAREAGVCAPE